MCYISCLMRPLEDYEFRRYSHKLALVVGCCGNKSDVVKRLPHHTRKLSYPYCNFSLNYLKVQKNLENPLTIRWANKHLTIYHQKEFEGDEGIISFAFLWGWRVERFYYYESFDHYESSKRCGIICKWELDHSLSKCRNCI